MPTATKGGFSANDVAGQHNTAVSDAARTGQDADFTESDNAAWGAYTRELLGQLDTQLTKLQQRYDVWRVGVRTNARDGANIKRNNATIERQVQTLNSWWQTNQQFLTQVRDKLRQYNGGDVGSWIGKQSVQPFPEGTIAGYPEQDVLRPLAAMNWIVNSSQTWDMNQLLQTWAREFNATPDFVNNPAFYKIAAGDAGIAARRPIATAKDLTWKDEEIADMKYGDVSDATSAADYLSPNYNPLKNRETADRYGLDAQKDAGNYFSDIFTGGGQDAESEAAYQKRLLNANQSVRGANERALADLRSRGAGMSGMELLAGLDSNEALGETGYQAALDARAQEQARKDSAADKTASIGKGFEDDVWGRASESDEARTLWDESRATDKAGAANTDREYEIARTKRDAEVAESAANNRTGANQQGFENWMQDVATAYQQGAELRDLMLQFPQMQDPSTWETVANIIGVTADTLSIAAKAVGMV